MKLSSFFIFCFFYSLCLSAQQTAAFTADQWEFKEYNMPGATKIHETEVYKGKHCLKLKNTTAVLKYAALRDGVINYFVCFPAERNFVGISFRRQDSVNAEEFYMRPHQSGNPDALQYQPLYNGRESWQLYHGEGFSAAVNFSIDQWMHIRLVINKQQLEVFIDDMEKPALYVPGLLGIAESGGIAIYGTARFADFTYTAASNPPIKTIEKPLPPIAKGTVINWSLSDTFEEELLQDVLVLSNKEKNKEWHTQKVDYTGKVNIAVANASTNNKNAVFARVVITSEKAQLKKLKIGFSDRVRIYLNDTIIYSGHDEFRSRDYRYLGTIGYFDELYLPLKKGKNEVWIAVSEDFGGWGLQAKFDDTKGISFQ